MRSSKSLMILVALMTFALSYNYYLWRKRYKISSHRKCHKVQQVAFIKSHKVGGTSVQNVLQRFGETNKLLAAIPRTRPVLDKDFHNMETIPKNLHYSMFYSHTQYFNRNTLEKFLPSGTLYFTIVREPLSQLTSAFYSHRFRFRDDYLSSMPNSTNPLREYLRSPDKYDPVDIKDCYTNNRMSYDLGLLKKHFMDTDAINKWLRKLDTDLDMILIREQFNQSMVLLKRKLCWELKDVLYVAKNLYPRKLPKISITSGELDIYHKRYLADVMLYNYSVKRFSNLIAEQKPDFHDEVSVFEKILNKATRYCQAAYLPHILLLSNLTIPQTNFNSEFQISPWDCEKIMLSELDFLRRTRGKQKDLMFIQSL